MVVPCAGSNESLKLQRDDEKIIIAGEKLIANSTASPGKEMMEREKFDRERV